MKYYERAILKKIVESLAIMPAIFINGPRQVGKSTLMHRIVQEHYISADYVTFDDITIRSSATIDPEGFLRSFTRPVIIDEVQKVKEIFPCLKLLIDEFRKKNKSSANGRFILTGSVSIMTIPELSQDLVGRMAIISLYPLSASEVLVEKSTGEAVINGWFDQTISNEITSEIDQKSFILDNVIHKTTFPEIVDMDKRSRDVWFNSYISTLLQRDVHELAEITKMAFVPNMLRMLAARVGSILNNANFAKDVSLKVMTYERYRILLEKVFLITLIKPWYRNINLRLVRTPKVYFTDTALLCHQLGVDPTELKLTNPILYGHILENFVFTELQKQINLLGEDYTLYYFRVHGNKEEEVDFVIERKNGSLIGVEVKSNYSVTEKDFISLNKLKKAVGKDFARGIVLYHGAASIVFGEDMVAMPINKLWDFNIKIFFDKDIYYLFPEQKIILWAQYGKSTRIRCDIERDTISDYFWNNPSAEDMKKVIDQYRDIITNIFIKKISQGQIYKEEYNLKTNVVKSRNEKILYTVLTPSDFEYQDFRKNKII